MTDDPDRCHLLIYAVNSDAPHHDTARTWLVDTLSGETAVGLPWICLLAFVRITTRRGILALPLDVSEALDYVDSWLGQPFVEQFAPAMAIGRSYAI